MKNRHMTDLEMVRTMSDQEIEFRAQNDPDGQTTEESSWADAVREEGPLSKEHINIRLSRRVIEFFKQQGPGYQTRINAVLEHYVEHHNQMKARGSR